MLKQLKVESARQRPTTAPDWCRVSIKRQHPYIDKHPNSYLKDFVKKSDVGRVRRSKNLNHYQNVRSLQSFRASVIAPVMQSNLARNKAPESLFVKKQGRCSERQRRERRVETFS